MKLKGRIIVFFILLFVAGIFSLILYKEGTLPVDKSNKTTKVFSIKQGDNITQVANNLAKEELIRNKLVFYLMVKQLGIEKKIQAGDFQLSSAMSLKEIALNLTHGSLDRWITVIEGLRKEEVAQIVGSALNLPESEFIKNADEGYLFPDTYLVPTNVTIESLVKIFKTNFDKRYTEAKQKVSKKNELTDNQVIVLASLIEREAKFDSDRSEVARILLRRIEEGHNLQVDATVQYALGYQPDQKTWWKKHTTFDDLKVDSTFNTYQNAGLPPFPICNPGLASIKAALSANNNTPYLFYVSDKSGKLHFAKDSDDHQKNIEKYLK